MAELASLNAPGGAPGDTFANLKISVVHDLAAGRYTWLPKDADPVAGFQTVPSPVEFTAIDTSVLADGHKVQVASTGRTFTWDVDTAGWIETGTVVETIVADTPPDPISLGPDVRFLIIENTTNAAAHPDGGYTRVQDNWLPNTP